MFLGGLAIVFFLIAASTGFACFPTGAFILAFLLILWWKGGT